MGLQARGLLATRPGAAAAHAPRMEPMQLLPGMLDGCAVWMESYMQLLLCRSSLRLLSDLEFSELGSEPAASKQRHLQSPQTLHSVQLV